MVHLHCWSNPLQARTLLPAPHHLADLSLALRTVQSNIILFSVLQPYWRIDEIRAAGLAMQNLAEQFHAAVLAAVIFLLIIHVEYHLKI